MSEEPKTPPPNSSSEGLVIMDDNQWLWQMTASCLKNISQPFVKVASNAPLRHSWSRFRNAPFMVIQWECKSRNGGPIVEEILEIDRRYDVANQLIILTTNPIHEDVVYFSELGLRRVIRARQRERDLEVAAQELKAHIQDILTPSTKPTVEGLWRKILVAIDRLTENSPEPLLQKIEDSIQKLSDPAKPRTARELDASAAVQFRRGKTEEAVKLLTQAIQANPNYFRAWNTLIDIRRTAGQHHEAYALLQKMQMHNRNSVRRLVAMGEEQFLLHDTRRAETYFKGALDKDFWCAKALNGLAEIKFDQGELDEARSLLSKSNIAYKFAAKLNITGIEMVRNGSYAEALEHYSRAQYVLPQQEKGPQLFYNIGLCYAKWGKMSMSEEFLKLALIKEPNYKKASRLLDQIRGRVEINHHEELEDAS